MKLLVVDDEWYAVKGISTGIDWASTDVDTVLEAFSAQEAMHLLDTNEIDVMICDIEMPDTSGLELAHWCMENHPSVKIIFLTGHASFPYASEAVRLKAFDYILKPVDHTILLHTVLAAMAQAQDEYERDHDVERWKDYQSRLESELPERTRLFWRNVIDNRLKQESIRTWLSLAGYPIGYPGIDYTHCDLG